MPDPRDPVSVSVAPEIVEQLATTDSEPVVIMAITRQPDGTHDMVLKSVYPNVIEEHDRYREALEEIVASGGDRSRGQLVLCAKEALRDV